MTSRPDIPTPAWVLWAWDSRPEAGWVPVAAGDRARLAAAVRAGRFGSRSAWRLLPAGSAPVRGLTALARREYRRVLAAAQRRPQRDAARRR